MVVQVQQDGKQFHVQSVESGQPPEHDGTYETKAKAEARAAVLAKLLKCDWETNY